MDRRGPEGRRGPQGEGRRRNGRGPQGRRDAAPVQRERESVEGLLERAKQLSERLQRLIEKAGTDDAAPVNAAGSER